MFVILLWLLGNYDNPPAEDVNQIYVKHSVDIIYCSGMQDIGSIRAFTFLCKVKGVIIRRCFEFTLWFFACLYDPFVYSGMATGTEGAECFAFAPFNMQP